MPSRQSRSHRGGSRTAAEARVTIGDLARTTGVNVETIRYYERAGILPRPDRTAAGYRLYSSADVGRLHFVRRARELGFSLDQVRELLGLADDPARPCDEIDAVARTHLAEVEAKLTQLEALRSELDHLLMQCRGGQVGDCRIVEALNGGTR